MTKHFRLLALAALLVLPLAACDEGDSITTAPPVTGTIQGSVTVDGTGQAGVTVTLSSGATQSTNSAGQYTFSNVAAGAYTVTISGAPADVAFPATAQATTITTAGQVQTVNFAGSRIRTSSILGSVTTTGGAALNGVTVTLSGTEARTATTAAGQYSVTGLRAGTYTVTISTIPTGNTCATTSASVTVAAGEAKVQNFTCTSSGPPAGTGTITGQLFIDANNNATLDGGEATLALSGVWVYAEGPTIGVKDSVKTTDGKFTFTGKAVGTYNVSVNPADPTFGNAGVSPVGATTKAVTLAANAGATVNFAFIPTQQRINVYAGMGRDANAAPTIPTSVPLTSDLKKPVSRVVIALYADRASADAMGAAGLLGTDTTDAKGEAQFSFLRTNDIGPNCASPCTAPDQIVFADYLSSLDGLAQNGETIIEIHYDVSKQPDFAPDTFDLLNPNTNLKIDAFGISSARPPLGGWNVDMRQNDTLAGPLVTTFTNANGRADFLVNVPLANLPDTFFFALQPAQAAAAGHAFTITTAPEAGTPVNRWLRYIVSGTARVADTIDVGDDLVKFSDADVMVQVHHEADDSVNGGLPRFSSGDNLIGVGSLSVSISWPASGALPAGSQTAGINPVTGVIVFPNVPTNRGPYVLASKTVDGNVFVLEEDTLFIVGTGGSLGDLTGGSNSTKICPLQGTAGCSTFAIKWNNNTINVTVTDTTGTVNADSVKVRIRTDPRTIQGRPTDTLLTVSRPSHGAPGWVTLTGVRDGFYIVSILHDSITATGDTIWKFVGTANNTVTVDAQSGGTGLGDIDNVVFHARRGDTSIRGFVVNDRDQDFNTVDPGEGLTGVSISLYRDNSGTTVTLDTLVKTITTDASGGYAFTGLPEGRYALKATSPTGAIVLRSFNASGAAVDTAIATTAATATPTCLIANNRRTVGSNDASCYSAGQPLPSWNYATSQAQNVGATNFTFLYSTGTVTGLIRKADLTPVAGMSVSIRRCLTSSAPNTPTAGACGSYDTSFAALTGITDATGRYTFANVREGVYESTPNPASVTGYTSTTPTQFLYTINDPNDVETGNFTANP